MKVLISGSTGLIGLHLCSFLESKGHLVIRLVRKTNEKNPKEIFWNPTESIIPHSLLEGFDAVIHLTGENLLGKWNKEKKERIRQSRLQGTLLLSQALAQLKSPPSVFICASAIGYYGNRGCEILTEESSKGTGFLADVCENWEASIKEATESGIRTLSLRLGVVLTSKGGMLKQILPFFKWGLGGQLGDGKQFFSWIALDDLLRIIDFALHFENLKGTVNAVSPYPVTNREFTKILGKILHRPTFFSIPAFMIKFILGQCGKELLLSSTCVNPQKLLNEQFTFLYPHLQQALSYTISRK